MNQLYTFNSAYAFAQAYGSDTYGAQEYSATSSTGGGSGDGATTGTGTTTAPNTGFFGLTPDAAISTGAGALLVALALVGMVFVITGRIKHRKKATKE